jgi:sterol desaturase/sphingolipid hydroxylase (fatty acid hydroxylase superfamily)
MCEGGLPETARLQLSGSTDVSRRPMKLSLITPLLVLAALLALFVVERFFSLRESKAGLLARLVVNGCMSAMAFVVAATLVRPAAMHTLDWASERPFGLLHVVPLPGWAQFVFGFLLLDLFFYYWHLLNHRIPLLWRFHNVHHIDPDLDVSTGFRFHFGEVLFSTLFRMVQVSAIGMSLATFAAYELVFQLNTLFHHSNLRLPIRVERWLNKVIVTPRMHGIHHSWVRRETNSNYGVVFPWWDRLHRTLGLNIPQRDIEIGIPGYSSPGDNTVWRSVVMPFIRQRDYWRKPDGSVPQRRRAETAPDDLAE